MYSKQQIIDTLNSEDIFIDNFLLEAFIKNWKIEPIYEDAEGLEFFDDMAVEKIKNGILQKQPKCEINIIDKNEIKPIDMSVEAFANTIEPKIVEIQSECIETNIEKNESAEITEEPIQESNECYTEEFANTTCANENQIQEILEQENVITPEIVDDISIEKELPLSIINEVNREVENELTNVTLDISNQTLTVLAESIARKITSDVSEFIKRTDLIEDAIQLGEYKKDNELLLEKIEELIADNKALIEKIKDLEKDNNSYVKLFGNVYMKNR